MRLPARAALALSLAVTILAGLGWAGVALATVSQGYHAPSAYPSGTLIALDTAHINTVVIADQTKLDALLGVVVPPTSAELALSPGKDTVQIATDGNAYALVSTENGSIKRGDHIAVSSIAGVGMRATSTTRVVGVAQADFDGTDGATGRQSITRSDGKQQEVVIGQTLILVSVSSFAKDLPPSNTVPPVIQRLIDQLIGKPVSPIKIIVSGIIAALTLIGVSALLYGSVQGALISIGRNPLSKKSIFRGLLQVMLVAAGVVAAAVGIIYFILRS